MHRPATQLPHESIAVLGAGLGWAAGRWRAQAMTPEGAACQVLLISGSLRAGSTNTAVLNTAAVIAPDGITTALYRGMGQLPHFNPDDDREGEVVDPAVAELRARIESAVALLICTPEYAGAPPGAIKNLLEWTVGNGGTYRKPVAWINASGAGAPTGGADANDSLHKVLRYTGADIVEAACARVPVTRDKVDPDGIIRHQQSVQRSGPRFLLSPGMRLLTVTSEPGRFNGQMHGTIPRRPTPDPVWPGHVLARESRNGAGSGSAPPSCQPIEFALRGWSEGRSGDPVGVQQVALMVRWSPFSMAPKILRWRG